MSTTTGKSLIELAPAYAAVVDEMMEAGGDLSDEDLAARLNAITGAFEGKVEACQFVYRRLTGDAAACDALVAELVTPYQQRAQRLRAGAERLKRYVYTCLKEANVVKVETPHGGARIQANGGVLPVLFDGDPKELPAMYQKVAISLDSEKVLAAHKAQEPLPEGVTVGERGQHLRWI